MEKFWPQEAKPSVTDAVITDRGSSVNKEQAQNAQIEP